MTDVLSGIWGGEFNGKKAVSPPSRPNSSFGMTGKMKIQTFYEAH
jgi:hypothetical protein